MAQLFMDENFPLPAIKELRRLEHDVVTIGDIGKANQSIPDPEVLALAVAARRILVTLNRKHFIRLHQAYPVHTGIIACTFDPNFIGLAQRIDAALQANPNRDNQLIRINRSG